jgi:hypothetical protein
VPSLTTAVNSCVGRAPANVDDEISAIGNLCDAEVDLAHGLCSA